MNPGPTENPDVVAATLVARARAAQRVFDTWTQERVDEAVTAAAWAIVEPGRNRALAELAVRNTGLGDVADKIAKNRRKTIGLLRDLKGAKSVGIISADPARGLVEIARPVGVVAAITPSTNPGATPANNIINALKGRNAIVLASSPKGQSTLTLLLEFVHAELDRIGAPRDLVLQLPAPVTRESTYALMRATDLVVATGSQTNVRAAYESGTPALGVGAGNVSVIVDETADLPAAAAKIARSKTFDHATSCSSENSVIAHASVYDALVEHFADSGGVLLDTDEARQLEAAMFGGGKLAPAFIAQSAGTIAARAGLDRPAVRAARFLIVAESGVGREHPFSGEKLSPVLALYRAHSFAAATALAERLLRYQGNGHSIGLHTNAPRTRTAIGSHAARLPRDRQPGALLRDRRQLRQCAAVLAVDGLRHLGRQQHLRQSELPALPQHHARRASAAIGPRARADRRRILRRVPRRSTGCSPFCAWRRCGTSSIGTQRRSLKPLSCSRPSHAPS